MVNPLIFKAGLACAMFMAICLLGILYFPGMQRTFAVGFAIAPIFFATWTVSKLPNGNEPLPLPAPRPRHQAGRRGRSRRHAASSDSRSHPLYDRDMD